MIDLIYKDLLQHNKVDSNSSQKLWEELENKYSEKGRHYHNLNHLQDLYDQLVKVKSKISNWNIILFTLFYHDVIYKSTKKNNEEESAKLASKRMAEIGLTNSEIELCSNQILATKSHIESIDSDTNYFTDADLSILGRSRENYNEYCKKIRKEYSIYPKFMYNKGRKQVVKHFLSMERIYKTEEFYSEFEEQAKLNLEAELETL